MIRDRLVFFFVAGALLLLSVSDMLSTLIAFSIEGFIEINPLWRLVLLYFGVKGFIYGKLLLTFLFFVSGIWIHCVSEKKAQELILLIFAFGCLYYAVLLLSNLLGLIGVVFK